MSLNGINFFIFLKHLVVLRVGVLAVLICEDLYRAFSAQTAQLSLLNWLSWYFHSFRRGLFITLLFRFTSLTTLNLTTSSDM